MTRKIGFLIAIIATVLFVVVSMKIEARKTFYKVTVKNEYDAGGSFYVRDKGSKEIQSKYTTEGIVFKSPYRCSVDGEIAVFELLTPEYHKEVMKVGETRRIFVADTYLDVTIEPHKQ